VPRIVAAHVEPGHKHGALQVNFRGRPRIQIAQIKCAELDHIPVLQYVPQYANAVDERAARAVQVLKNVVVTDLENRSVLAVNRCIIDDNLIVGLPADAHAILVEKALVQDGPSRTQDQFCHQLIRASLI
jgi:hypothetical protein